MDLRYGTHGRIPVAMTIAGSDSGGGAGIEADLKTFAALGVHGTVALTAITAQNTYSVTGVQDVELEIIAKQIDAVAEDLGIDAAKTGMLHTSEIIRLVAEKVREYGFPLVVDPVMIAKSGAPLLKKEAVKTLIEVLIPIATVITPNIPEAEVITGLKIKDREDMLKAAKRIVELGPKAVVVKGGHAKGMYSIDILYHEGEVVEFKSPRYEVKTTHGTGCSFSAAIAAELAKGKDVVSAVKMAKKLISLGIRYGIPVGKGHGPVNPMAILYKEAAKYSVLRRVFNALMKLEEIPNISRLVPEVGMNLAEAIPYAEDMGDVVAVPGRVRSSRNGRIFWSCPDFNASSHLARYIMKAMEYDPSIRAAINVRFNRNFIEAAEKLGFKVSYYDRREEPPEVKAIEGMTVQWGLEQAIKRIGCLPDVVYHEGDWGKEPMIVVLGHDAADVVNKVAKIWSSIEE